MSTPKVFDDLLPHCRRILRDEEGQYWTDDELRDYLNEGQEEFVRQTWCLRAQRPITKKENEETYLLPEDCLEVIRMENTDGTQLVATTSRELQAQHGDGWRDTTGTPESFYSDLDGNGKVRFYPRPVPSTESPLTTFDLSRLQLILEDPNDVVTIAPWDDGLAVMTGTHVMLIDADYNVIRKVAHGLTVDISIVSTAALPMMAVGEIGGVPYWVYSDGLRLYKCAFDGSATVAMSLAAVDVRGVFGLTGSGGAYVMYVGSDNHVYKMSTTAPGYAETDLGDLGGTPVSISMYQRAGVGYDADYAFAALGAGGLKSCDLTGPPALVQAGTFTAVFVASGGDVYVCKATDIQKCNLWDTWFATVPVVWAATSTGATATAMTKGLVVSGRYIIASMYSSPPVNYYVRKFLISDVTDYSDVSCIYKEGGFNAYNEQVWLSAIGDRVAMIAFTAVSGSDKYSLVVEDEDIGAVVNLSDEAFDSEIGEVVDYRDTDETAVTFSNEEGIVTQVVEDDDPATVFYVRMPEGDEIELPRWQPMVDYAIHKAYEKDEDRQNIPKSQYYFGKFMVEVARMRRNEAQGFNRAASPVTGYWY